MIHVATALTPIFLLILLGRAFKTGNFPGDSFWPMAERITYYVFFPALLFNSLYAARFEEMLVGPTVATIGLSMFFISAVMLGFQSRLGFQGAVFSSFFQGGLRPNTYVGISAAYVLFGAPGLATAALVIAVMIPLSNLFSVIILSIFGDDPAGCRTSPKWLQIGAALFRNPLILACLLGVAANLTGLNLGLGTKDLFTVLSQASLPLGLLCVGAGLQISGLAGDGRVIGLSSAIKLGALPLLAALLAWLFNLDPKTAAIVLIFSALPCGPAAYVLARQLGGDINLMAKIITIQTLAAFLTMPLALSLIAP